jgi:hypothetical protein
LPPIAANLDFGTHLSIRVFPTQVLDSQNAVSVCAETAPFAIVVGFEPHVALPQLDNQLPFIVSGVGFNQLLDY